MGGLEDSKANLAKQLMALNQELKDLRRENQGLRDSLAQSEERAEVYRTVVDNINETLYRIDINGNITYISPSVEAMSGYTPGEIIGSRFSQYVHADHLAVARQHFKDVLSGGSTGSEYRLVIKGGSTIWIKSSSRPLYSGGQVVGLQGTLVDITERKKMQDELIESEARLKGIFDATKDSIFIKDRDLVYVQVNRAMEELFGRPAEELLGSTDVELFGPEAAAEVMAQDRLVLAGETVEGESARLIRGQPFTFHVVKTPLYDQAGQVVGICGVARDISERRRARDALAESEENFRQLAENIKEVFWLGTPDGSKVYYVSPAYQEVWGRSCQSLIDRPMSWMDAVVPDDRAMIKKDLQDKAGGDLSDPCFPEYRIVRPDGTQRWIAARAFPIKDAEGQVYRIAGIAEDITARKEVQSHIATLVSSMVVATSQVFFDRTVEKICQWLGCEISMVAELVKDGRLVARGMLVDGEHIEDFSLDLAGTPCGQVVENGPQLYPSRLGELFPNSAMLAELGAVSYIGLPLTDDQGEVIGVLCAMSRSEMKMPRAGWDVLRVIAARAAAEINRMRAEAQAKVSQDIFVKAFQASPAWVAITTLAEGRFLLVNEAFTTTTGYGKDEIMGRTGLELNFFKNPEDRARAMETFKESGRLRNYEIDIRFKDGGVHHMLLSAEPLDFQGQECWITVFIDITDRKHMEMALKHSEATLRSIYQAAPIGIGMVYGGERILGWCNERICEMTGYNSEELMGMPAHNLYPSEEEYLRVGREKHAAVRTKGSGSVQTVFRRKDGTTFDVLLSSSQINPEDFDAGLVFTVMDITGQQQMEKEREVMAGQLRQAQKMEAIGTLAGGIAHDFNNILGAVMGYAELALEDMAEGLVCIFELEQVIKAAERGRELVKEILTFSRKGRSNLTMVDLNQEVKDTTRLLYRTLPKMVEIRLDLAHELMKIEGDTTQLGQVLMNLGTNSSHAMPEGGVITISTKNVILSEDYCRRHMEVRPGRYVQLAFSDTGHGMDQDTLDKIFDPFFTTKGVGEGTGLGMSTLYGIVKGHSGHVVVTSEPGEGTIFNIYIPAIEDLVAPNEAKRQEEPTDLAGDETILLVDDEPALRDVGEQILVRKGYKVLTASSGEEALRVYQQNNGGIDLVVLDVGMPGMGGDQCLIRMMEMDPEAKVIIASGYSRHDRLLETLGSGARGYIPKPYRRDDVLGEVRRVLDQSGGREAGED